LGERPAHPAPPLRVVAAERRTEGFAGDRIQQVPGRLQVHRGVGDGERADVDHTREAAVRGEQVARHQVAVRPRVGLGSRGFAQLGPQAR